MAVASVPTGPRAPLVIRSRSGEAEVLVVTLLPHRHLGRLALMLVLRSIVMLFCGVLGLLLQVLVLGVVLVVSVVRTLTVGLGIPFLAWVLRGNLIESRAMDRPLVRVVISLAAVLGCSVRLLRGVPVVVLVVGCGVRFLGV